MNMYCQYLRNPKEFVFWRKVTIQYPASKKFQIVTCVHYCSSSFISKNKNYIKELPKKIMTVLCTPAEALLSLYIKRNGKKLFKIK